MLEKTRHYHFGCGERLKTGLCAQLELQCRKETQQTDVMGQIR